MELILQNPQLGGEVTAPPSKSMAHRLLVCAALADRPCHIPLGEPSGDIIATLSCLEQLGASILREENEEAVFSVTPIRKIRKNVVLDCGESGSTLRFLLPVSTALGADAAFFMHGRLPNRPLAPILNELEAHGITLSPDGTNPFYASGTLPPGSFSVCSDQSTQFASGLLLALPHIGRYVPGLLPTDEPGFASLRVTGELARSPYLAMTLSALEIFGLSPTVRDVGEDVMYDIPLGMPFVPPASLTVEGDWSNAAFWLAAGAIGENSVTVRGLKAKSAQGDKRILSVLEQFGAMVLQGDSYAIVRHAPLRGIRLYAAEIPDLVPVIAAVAAVSEGETVINGIQNLRYKESDRLSSICLMLSSLGADIRASGNSLRVFGKSMLRGGKIPPSNDHRIVMAAAIASIRCKEPVIIPDREVVCKSYPTFFTEFERLEKNR